MKILKNNGRKNRLIKKLRRLNLSQSELLVLKRQLRAKEKRLSIIEMDASEYRWLKQEREYNDSQYTYYMERCNELEADVNPLLEIKHRYFELLKQLNVKNPSTD